METVEEYGTKVAWAFSLRSSNLVSSSTHLSVNGQTSTFASTTFFTFFLVCLGCATADALKRKVSATAAPQNKCFCFIV